MRYELRQKDFEENFWYGTWPIGNAEYIIKAINKKIDSRLNAIQFTNRVWKDNLGTIRHYIYFKRPEDVAILLYRLDEIATNYRVMGLEDEAEKIYEELSSIMYGFGVDDFWWTVSETDGWPHIGFYSEHIRDGEVMDMPINEAIELLGKIDRKD